MEGVEALCDVEVEHVETPENKMRFNVPEGYLENNIGNIEELVRRIRRVHG